MRDKIPRNLATQLARHHEEREETYRDEEENVTETLHSWIQTRTATSANEPDYLFGEVYDQFLDPWEFYEYNPSAQSPIYRYKTHPKARKAEFWLNTNPEKPVVLFDNADNAYDFGMRVVSNALFGRPRCLERASLDVKRIGEDAKAGRLTDQRTHLFRDRHGNIRPGRFMGSKLWTDPSVAQTVTASRNAIGLDVLLEDEVVRVMVTGRGAMIIYRNWNKPEMWGNVHDLVELFLPYGISGEG